ncbi:glycoside hydrolase family 9 protein [Bacteroides heparinolyticus]|uniref:glycoside hydrolase family 9 protein n=1 Tax=Prevotella heparinolytica TaxID=28113 RepID=UPI00359F3754
MFVYDFGRDEHFDAFFGDYTFEPVGLLSASDGIAEPLLGFLVGGPNPGRQDGVSYPSNLPDESYADVGGSYASNEIAINWSAALAALASSLDALMAK